MVAHVHLKCLRLQDDTARNILNWISTIRNSFFQQSENRCRACELITSGRWPPHEYRVILLIQLLDSSDFIQVQIWYGGPVYEPSHTEVKFQVSSLDALLLSTEIECNICSFCAYIFSVKINIDFESYDFLARNDFACDVTRLHLLYLCVRENNDTAYTCHDNNDITVKTIPIKPTKKYNFLSCYTSLNFTKLCFAEYCSFSD